MAILNITPDSFSDGGRLSKLDLRSLIESYPPSTTILDIGGQSTSPTSKPVSPEEEISRILPIIKQIRSFQQFNHLAISVDTFYSSVARAAINAGADIINDVSAGLLDPSMLSTIASLGSTCILMHMRGTPSTMQSPANTSYPNGLIPTLASELLHRISAAEAAGIRRWRIILDPGLGFAKTTDQNLEILREFEELKNWPGLEGFPWLVGSSNKTFVGKVTGVEEPRKRGWGTAATVAAAVQGGADIVRVHGVEEMAQVARMADAIWRV